MVPQPSSFTVAKQHGQFTAGGVVSIDGWCLLSAGAKQQSCHSSDLQIIGSSFLDGYLWRARFAQGVSRRPVLKTVRCLGRSRAAGEKREACSGRNDAEPDGCFGTFRLHEIEMLSGSKMRIERNLADLRRDGYRTLGQYRSSHSRPPVSWPTFYSSRCSADPGAE